MIERIDTLSRLSRTSWLTLIAYLAFIGVTLLGVEDADFFIDSRETELPLIGITIPTFSFFIFGPLVGVALYAYLHLQLRKLWDPLMKAAAQEHGLPLGERIHPWVVNDLALRLGDPKHPPRPMDWLAGLTTRVLVWLAAPLIFLGFWWRSMPAHDQWLTLYLAGLAFLSLYVGLSSWWQLLAKTRGYTNGSLFGQIALLLGFVLGYGMYLYPYGWCENAICKIGEDPETSLPIWSLAESFVTVLALPFVIALILAIPLGTPSSFKRKSCRGAILGLILATLIPVSWLRTEAGLDHVRLQMVEFFETLGIDDFTPDEFKQSVYYDSSSGEFRVSLKSPEPRGQEAWWLLSKPGDPWHLSLVARHISRNLADLTWSTRNNEGNTALMRALCKIDGQAGDDCSPLREAQLADVDFRPGSRGAGDWALGRLNTWRQICEARGIGARACHAPRWAPEVDEIEPYTLTARRDWCKDDFSYQGDTDDAACDQYFIDLEKDRLNEVWQAEREAALAAFEARDLSGRDLRRANLHGALLPDVVLTGARLDHADLSFAQLQGAVLESSHLQGVVLSFAQLQDADLREAQLQGADLRRAQLQGAGLGNAQLQDADLREAQLQGADLRRAQLQGAGLGNAQLQGASLWRAQLQGAGLSGAQLQGAYLGYAKLQGADLTEAQLQGAALNGARWAANPILGADFRDVIGFDASQTVSMVGVMYARLPEGVSVMSCWQAEPQGFDRLVQSILSREFWRDEAELREFLLCDPDGDGVNDREPEEICGGIWEGDVMVEEVCPADQ